MLYVRFCSFLKNNRHLLKKIKEPSWYEKMYNKSTVENKGLRNKIVGDLQFEDGNKII